MSIKRPPPRSSMADVWYNVGHVGVALGDLGLAYQAFKVRHAAWLCVQQPLP